MKTTNLYQSFKLILALTVIALGSQVHAQGVTGVVVTNHIVQPGPQIVIGTATSPIPIDLDPNGAPWFKNIGDPQFNAAGPSIVDLYETIVNVGTEPWTDWHEVLLPAPAGLAPHTWASVVNLSINGNSIGFSSIGVGTQTLDFYAFSQPVLPGDVFSIHKQLSVAGTAGTSGAFLRIQEYPTSSVPEPSTALIAIGTLSCLAGRRFRM